MLGTAWLLLSFVVGWSLLFGVWCVLIVGCVVQFVVVVGVLLNRCCVLLLASCWLCVSCCVLIVDRCLLLVVVC